MTCLTFHQALNSAISSSMQVNNDVIVLGQDIGDPANGIYKVTDGLEKRFGPKRVVTTPISEQGIIGMGIGLALSGKRPVCEIMLMDYLTIASDQIVNHAAKLAYMTGDSCNVPITVRMHVGGGTLGGAQHSQSLEAWLTHIPGLEVIMPSNPKDAMDLLQAAISSNKPSIFLESVELLWDKTKYSINNSKGTAKIGTANVVCTGNDITLLCYGRSVRWCIEASRILFTEMNITCEIVDIRTLSPLDTDTVFESVIKTGRTVIVHAATKFCGFGAEVSSIISENCHKKLKHPPIRVGAKHTPVPYSEALENNCIPSVSDVVKAAKKVLDS